MPTTPKDLAALVTGGSSPGAISPLQGMIVDRTNARSGSTESDLADGSDFQSLLDNPPAHQTNPETSEGTAPSAAPSFGRGLREGLSGSADSGRCVLSAEWSAVATGALQIKGVISGWINQNRSALPQESSGLDEPLVVAVPAEVPPDGLSAPPPTIVARPVMHGQETVPPLLPNLTAAALSVLVTGNIPALNITASCPEKVSVGDVNEYADGVAIPGWPADGVGVSEHEASTVPVDNPSSEPVKPGQGRRGPALRHQLAAVPYFACADGRLSSVKKHHDAEETIRGVTTAPLPATVIAADQRRDLIETVAGLLAPLWSALPKVLPPTTPIAHEGSTDGEATWGGDGRKTLSAVVTIKLAGQASITLELPYSNSTPAYSSSAIQKPAATVLADHAEPSTGQVPATDSVQPLLHQLASGSDLPDQGSMDFRIQLKAKIETAWAKEEPVATEARSELNPLPPTLGDGEQDHTALIIVGRHPVHAELLRTASAILGETPISTAQNLKQPPLAVSQAVAPVTPVELLIEMPGFGSLAAEIVAAQSAANLPAKKRMDRFDRAEKTAGDFKSVGLLGREENVLSEKIFLNPVGQSLESKLGEAGTDVAISGDNMPAPFTSRRLSVDPLELPPRFNLLGELFQGLNDSQRFAASAEVAESATPAPVLAHRAVESIMNVVEAQRNGTANATSVNLHFKFGGDDLAVRVQLRGGEVHTQFLTDSAELRRALSSEWQIMAGQGGAAGLRLLDPSILPASAGVSTGFGTASQGQNQAQQQQQANQQEAQTAAAFPKFRALRRPGLHQSHQLDTAPRVSMVPPTSHHLTALA